MPQAFYRKWRPRRWDAVVGQEHVVTTLRNAIASGRTGHAYLFSGPRGTGKTTTARLLAKAVNCLNADAGNRPCDACDYCEAVNKGRFLDLIEIDAASNTSVEDVRDLRDKINFSPNQGKYKVYIIDEVHMLSTAAFNALLKTLEEPPSHAIFVLATTEVHKIPATVMSRCQRHEFRRIAVSQIVEYLQQMARDEGVTVAADALTLIARQSTGSMRDAISLLDQLASTGEEITLEKAQAVLGTAASQAVVDMVGALTRREAADGLRHLGQALEAGSDARQFARQVVEYLRSLLLMKMGNSDMIDVTQEMRSQMESQAEAVEAREILQAIKAFNQAANETRGAWQPSLPLEMAYVEALGYLLRGSEVVEQAPAAQKVVRSVPSPKVQAYPRGDAPASEPEIEAEAGGGGENDEIRKALAAQWKQILQAVRQSNANAYGLLNSCKSKHMKGNVLVLGFASDVLKNQMVKKENLELVQQVVTQAMGADIRVQCVINTSKRTTIPADVDQDGMVAAALRDLGGEIVDVQG